MKQVTVRLGCIDAPESTQAPWGQQSANRLKQLLPVGQAVQVREIDRDQYGRTVAQLYLGNQSVNLRMVKEGQAVVYTQYLNGCSDACQRYIISVIVIRPLTTRSHLLGTCNNQLKLTSRLGESIWGYWMKIWMKPCN